MEVLIQRPELMDKMLMHTEMYMKHLERMKGKGHRKQDDDTDEDDTDQSRDQLAANGQCSDRS